METKKGNKKDDLSNQFEKKCIKLESKKVDVKMQEAYIEDLEGKIKQAREKAESLKIEVLQMRSECYSLKDQLLQNISDELNSKL